MTDNSDNLAQSLVASMGLKPDLIKPFEKLGLSFNPFPRAGISDLNGSPYLVSKLEPIDLEVKKGIEEFIRDSLFPENPLSSDKYTSGVIRGEYGYGKTQTLLYAKLILESFNTVKDLNRRPYVIYIDNPGAKLTELIGAIVSQIGEENFRRYLWNIAFDSISNDPQLKNDLNKLKPLALDLFDNHLDPFDPVNLVSYKAFLDAWYSKVLNSNPSKKKLFQDKLKTHIIKSFTAYFQNGIIALYFYDLLLDNIGINKTWELLTSGSAKDLDKKEVFIIKAIVNLIENQGYTNFYILVDEFEAVTAGRLSNSDIDRYVTNLRALIDKERNWCALFAMTGFALDRLKAVSPPLAERISGRIIELKNLDNDRAKKITINYLNLARAESDALSPFDESGIETLRIKSQGILRVFLKSCYILIQRASEEFNNNEVIDTSFVNKYFQVED